MLHRATSFDADTLAKNANAFLATAQSYVRPTDAIIEAFEQARIHIEDFRTEIRGRVALSAGEASSVENARQLALIAIDRLNDVLADARPSEDATAIGLGWF
jgi:hypothetical protein